MRNPRILGSSPPGAISPPATRRELTRDSAGPIALTERMLTDTAEQGLLRSADLKRIDGHFPRWRAEERKSGSTEEGVLAALQSQSSFAAR